MDYSIHDKYNGKYTEEYKAFSANKSMMLNKKVMKIGNILSKLGTIGTCQNWRLLRLLFDNDNIEYHYWIMYCTYLRRGTSTEHEAIRHLNADNDDQDVVHEELKFKIQINCEDEDNGINTNLFVDIINKIMLTDTAEEVYKIFIELGKSFVRSQYIRTADGKKYACYYTEISSMNIEITDTNGTIKADIEREAFEHIGIEYSFYNNSAKIEELFKDVKYCDGIRIPRDNISTI